MEKILISIMNHMINHSRRIPRRTVNKNTVLKLLLLGYNGAANAGSDLRVDEMIRQFHHLLGASAHFTTSSLDLNQTQNYFGGTTQIHLKKIFPRMLYQLVKEHDGVIGCEGSMFKSRFSNTLSILMASGLGLASAQQKLSMGYGGEVGFMEPLLEAFVQKSCHDSLIITRNEKSTELLKGLDISCLSGTDTAWTYHLRSSDEAMSQLKQDGWDGIKKILVLVPVNPFMWPVRPSISKYLQYKLSGRFAENYYDSIYFHEYDELDKKKFSTYIDALAEAATVIKNKYNLHVILIGTERLDDKPCRILAQKMGGSVPVYSSRHLNYHEIFSLLTAADYLITSRFHAMLVSMLKLIPSIGVSIDERIDNLMNQRQHGEYLNHVDDECLATNLISQFDRLLQNEAVIKRNIGILIPKNLKVMSSMGKMFLDELHKVYPGIELKDIDSSQWQNYLPPLSPSILSIIEQYGAKEMVQ